jgi:zinc transporter ZupT
MSMQEISVGLVFAAALITAIATGLGALPFLFVRDMTRTWLGISNAAAAGLMLAASFSLIVEGNAISPTRTIIGLLLGVVLIALCHRAIDGHDGLAVGQLRGADARKAIMIVGIMTAHSIAEGVGVGVSYGGGEALGTLITAAIAVHNVPEGLAISLVLVPRGASVLAAAGWSIVSSLPQPVMAVPAFLFVTVFAPFLPIGFGLAAGAMIWMTLAELLPDALKETSNTQVAAVVTISVAAMLGFQAAIAFG